MFRHKGTLSRGRVCSQGTGYNWSFRFLGCVALLPVMLYAVGVGETAPHLRPPVPTHGGAEPAALGQQRHRQGMGADLCDRLLFVGSEKRGRFGGSDLHSPLDSPRLNERL